MFEYGAPVVISAMLLGAIYLQRLLVAVIFPCTLKSSFWSCREMCPTNVAMSVLTH